MDAQARPVETEGGSAERPIDLVHLSKYTLGNRALEIELLGIFRAQAQVYLKRLVEAPTNKEWRDAAHSLKGSARSLGAWTLGQQAEDAELLAGPDAPECEAALTRIRDAIDSVNFFIDDLLLPG